MLAGLEIPHASPFFQDAHAFYDNQVFEPMIRYPTKFYYIFCSSAMNQVMYKTYLLYFTR